MNGWVSVATCAIGVAVLGAATETRGGAVAVIHQIGRAFSQAAIQINRGDTINFSNDDSFDHQIMIDSPTFKFESPGQSPGSITPVVFSKSGTFEVRCEIHPRMRLAVTVQ